MSPILAATIVHHRLFQLAIIAAFRPLAGDGTQPSTATPHSSIFLIRLHAPCLGEA